MKKVWQTDKQTDRQTDRQTDGRTDRQTGRQAGRWAGGQTGGRAGRQAGRQTDRQTDRKRQTDRRTDRQTGRQAGGQMGGRADGWAGRQAGRQTDRQTKRETDRQVFLELLGCSKKQKGTYASSSFVHHFIAICVFKLGLWSGNAQIEAKFVLTSVTLTFHLDLLHGHHILLMVITQLKISWWYDDGNMVKMVWQTDGRMDIYWTIHKNKAFLWTKWNSKSL